jgi:aspartate/methionine/tyrosine aminotransferase
LAESTARDLQLGEILALVAPSDLAGLRLGYGSLLGLPALRKVVGERSGVPADQVLITQGASIGIALLALELCGDGKEAIVFRPCFPPSRDVLLGVGAKVTDLHLTFDHGYKVNLDRFAAALSPKIALVSLASPQSPSGVRTDADTIQQMLALITERAPEAVLFLDETYSDSTYGDAEPVSFASLDHRIVTASSVSKAHGAPGLRTGWLTVPDPALLDRLAIAKTNLTISGSPLTETLAAALLESIDEVLRPRRRFLTNALNMVAAWQMREVERLDWVHPDGGALCIMRLRRQHFSDIEVETFWKALSEHELQLAEGNWFGEERRTFRLGFGYLSLNTLEEGLAALSVVMDEVTSTRPRRQHGVRRFP